jgi:KDO2-lipid IV(A) lauroyltransferase
MRESIAKIRRRIYYYGALMFSKLVLLLPYKFSVGFLSDLFGGLAYYVARPAANIAIKNLRERFPDKSKKEVIKITKQIFCNEAKNFFELANFPRMDSKFLKNISTVENENLIIESLKKGKGILFVSAHAGNWEITAAAVAELGVPVNVVARKIYIDQLNSMLVKYRESKKVKVILRDAPDSARKLLRALKKGEIIAMLIDQDTEVAGVFVDFFGEKAWTPSGLAVLALRTGADVLVGLDKRVDKYFHRTVVSGPITIVSSGDRDKDVENLTQKASSILEEHIRHYPDQWVWFHERWRTRPCFENRQ